MRFKPFHIGLVLVSLVLGSVQRALAWGGAGHSIVAAIATARLDDAAKAQVADLLGTQKLTDIASWADAIRSQRSETGPWHYVDIPIDKPAFDEARDGQNGNNVIDQLNHFISVLSDKSQPKAARTEALKFVVHFTGDMHQPLHCSDRNDRGGNSRLVFLLDQPRAINLHSVWDSGILSQSMGNTDPLVYASGLNARISAKDAADWSKGTPLDWANESHQIAVDFVYKGIPADGPPPKLNRDYVDAAEKIVDQQLSRGGVRLAMVLNNAIGNGAPTQPATQKSE